MIKQRDWEEEEEEEDDDDYSSGNKNSQDLAATLLKKPREREEQVMWAGFVKALRSLYTHDVIQRNSYLTAGCMEFVYFFLANYIIEKY